VNPGLVGLSLRRDWKIWPWIGGASEDDHLWKAMGTTTDQATSVPPNGFAWEFMRTIPRKKDQR
jgi:hypothetical protein